MAFYVGLSDNLQDITNITAYYDKLLSLNISSFANNYDQILQFKSTKFLDAFEGSTVDLVSPWPSLFATR